MAWTNRRIDLMMKKGFLVVISGPSGVGKGTICKELLTDEKFVFSVSATTRQMRKGEVNGRDYHFLTVEDFKNKIDNREFLEWAQVYDNYYGTLKSEVLQKLDEGFNVLLDIDTAGAKQVKEKMPEAMLFFLMPPSVEVLEARLRGRATDSDDVIAKRLSCFEYELTQQQYYDHIVTNDVVAQAVAEIKNIIGSKQN